MELSSPIQMSPRIIALCVVIFVARWPAHAADSTNAAPRRFGPPQPISPVVQADRTVTFRVRAPNATNVTVSGEWPGAKAMTKDDAGNWSATVGPLAPELYSYSFSIDGFQTL